MMPRRSPRRMTDFCPESVNLSRRGREREREASAHEDTVAARSSFPRSAVSSSTNAASDPHEIKRGAVRPALQNDSPVSPWKRPGMGAMDADGASAFCGKRPRRFMLLPIEFQSAVDRYMVVRVLYDCRQEVAYHGLISKRGRFVHETGPRSIPRLPSNRAIRLVTMPTTPTPQAMRPGPERRVLGDIDRVPVARKRAVHCHRRPTGRSRSSP